MAGALMEFAGAKNLRRTLRLAGDDLSDLKAAHKAAADIAAAAARPLTPRVSGSLMATVRSAGTKTAGIIRAGNNSKVRYANPIQWGWHRRHIKANPFLTNGAQRSESRWIQVYVTYTDSALNKIKGM